MSEPTTHTPFPVEVSETALAQIQRLIAKDGRDGVFLRIGVKGGGCSGLEYMLKLDTVQKSHDLEEVLEGVKLVCDLKSAVFLAGSTLDYTGNLIGGGFKFDNPNAKRSCGCGTSFTPKDR
ncbi:MAG: iron-sulfur cluster assembly accessory protein [Fimbriimonadales bacterium]